jgi:hypothetical protein
MLATRDRLLADLRALKPEMAARYNVKAIELFGSFVHGEQDEASDIDLLVDFTQSADLFDLVGLGLFLEEALQRKVDVVPRTALREELREAVISQAVPV